MYRTVTLILILASSLLSQEQIILMSYNLLDYPSDTSGRNPYFRTILKEVSPDILVVQEITSLEGVTAFLENVLNYEYPKYSAGDYINGPDRDNAIFYKDSILSFISNTPIGTNYRDINEFKLVYNTTGDTLRVFSLHLKAGKDPYDEEERAKEVDSLRKFTDSLPIGTYFIVCGDFNIYYSDEPAFQKLLEVHANTQGHLIDPLDLVGYWHSNIAFAPYHTQSTRGREFGNGAGGGLDDRFDMILISEAVSDTGGISYVDGSYVAFGNDGYHLNDSINDMPNYAVSPEVANALYYASDHLPVFCSIEFDTPTTVKEFNERVSPGIVLYQNYPNPFNSTTTISYELSHPVEIKLAMYDILGREVIVLDKGFRESGVHRLVFNADALPSGVYINRLFTHNISLDESIILLKERR